jgi:hypothetical protein
MEVLQVAEQIEKIIVALTKEGKLSKGFIEAKAKASAEYDKSVGVRTAALKAAGKPSTIIKELAKGDASDALYAKIVAEDGVRSHFARMENLRAQMNGYQSINKYLDNTAH